MFLQIYRRLIAPIKFVLYVLIGSKYDLLTKGCAAKFITIWGFVFEIKLKSFFELLISAKQLCFNFFLNSNH